MNEELKKLVETRNKLIADMRAIIDKNPGGLDSEKEAQYAKMEKDFEATDKQIKRMSALIEAEAHLNAPASKPLTNAATDKPVNEDDYKKVFFDMIRYGSENMSAESKALLAGYQNALETGTPNKGGYLVPTVIANEIISGLNAYSWIRSLSSVMQTSSETNIPLDESIPTFGWIAENGAYGETDITLGQKVLSAYKTGGIIKISEELLQDSAFNIDAHLRGKIIAGLDAAEEPAFLTGDGIGKPTGVVTSAGTGVTAAAINAITSDEVVDFVYSVKPRYREGAVIVASSDWIKAVRKLKDSNGQYLWQPSYRAGEPDTIMGKPYRESEYLPALATGATPAVIANFRYYQIGDRGGMYIQRLEELYSGTGQVGYRVRKRTDGVLTIAEAAKKFVMA